MPTLQTTPTVTTFSPTVGTPNRGTTESELDTFNKQFRSSPLYQNFMRSQGLRTDGRVKLSRKQQSNLEQAMARAGFSVPKGMHIDQGGNLNQKNRLGRNVAITAAIVGGTIATLGAAGAFAPAATGAVTSGGAATGAGTAAAGAGTAAGTTAGFGAAAPVFGAATPTAIGGVTAPVFGASTAAAASAAPVGVTAGLGATAPVFGAATTTGLGATAPVFGSAATGVGSSVTAPVFGSTTPALASTPTATGVTGLASAPTYGGAATRAVPAIAKTVGSRAMGLSADNWIDIGGRIFNAGSQIVGNKQANDANDRSAELLAQGNADELQFEKDKEARRQYEWDEAQKVAKRNFDVEQEARLEDLRQQEAKDAQGEPMRLAREQVYRSYMKKYWNIDVAPSVARRARQIADVSTASAPTSSAGRTALMSSGTTGTTGTAGTNTAGLPPPDFTAQTPAPVTTPAYTPPVSHPMATSDVVNDGTPFQYRRQFDPRSDTEYS